MDKISQLSTWFSGITEWLGGLGTTLKWVLIIAGIIIGIKLIGYVYKALLFIWDIISSIFFGKRKRY